MLNHEVFDGITLNLFLLLLVIFIYSMTPLGRPNSTNKNALIFGVLIGFVGIGIMLSPMELFPGFVLDTRSILIAITGLFFGVIPTFIATIMMALYRITQGGIGAIPGVLVLLSASFLGILGNKYRFKRLVQNKKSRIIELYVLGVVVHIAMLLCMLTLPNQMAWSILRQISIPVMIVYPIGTLLLGILLFYQLDQDLMQKKFQLYVENAPFGIFVIDKEGIYHDVNEAGINLTGYSKTELIGKTISDLTHPDDLKEVLKSFSKLVDQEEINCQCRYITNEGNTRNWEIKGIKMDDSFCLGYTTDITTQVHQELEIKSINFTLGEMNDRFQLALHAADLAVWDWDIINDTLLWDDQMYALYGLDKDNGLINYERWLETIHPMDEEKVREEILLALKGEKAYDTDFRINKQGNATQIIKAFGHITRDESGKPLKMTGINYDITKQRQNEHDLMEAKVKAEAANAAKDRFLAMMSHEIRTPMNGFIGMIQLMQMTKLTSEQEEYLRIAKFSAEALLAVVNDILDYSKIDAGKMSLNLTNFGLKSLIRDTVALFSLAANNKHVPVMLYFDEDVPDYCIGDSLKIRQVIANILGNAVKFTNSGKIEIDISVAEKLESNQIKLRCIIKDTGIGIPSDKIDLLFKGFSQIDNSNTRKFGGTGLGLAISKALVELMGGAIEVDSQEDLGSRFSFVWQVDIDNQVPCQENLKEQTREPVERLETTILLVEDDAVSRTVIEALAQKKGWRVISAVGGTEALVILQDRQVDLICMDVQMPGMDGYETTRAIREMESVKNIHTPIIAMTANALQGDREKCIEAGMNDYLSKPIRAEQFYEYVYKWIN